MHAWTDWMWAMTWQVTVVAGAVWVLTRLLRKSGASLRYALWLLVFVKLVVPPSLAAPWSVGTVVQAMDQTGSYGNPPAGAGTFELAGQTQTAAGGLSSVRLAGASWPAMALAVWAAVAAGMLAVMLGQGIRLHRAMARDLQPPQGELAEIVCALSTRLGLRTPVSVAVSPHVRIPAVMGFLRPLVLLPASVVEELSTEQLSDLIGHELAHAKRRDVQVGWVVALLMCVYWFHPAVWLANLHLRREREMACDDEVLYATRKEGKKYASTIIRVAEAYDETVPVGAGYLGLMEVSENLLERIRAAADVTRRRRMGRGSLAALVALAALLLPMGVWTPATSAQEAAAPASPAPPALAEPAAPASAPVERAADASPRLLASEPAHQATDVDPAVTVIRLKFDVDMAGGFSWTGGPPLFPETTGAPHWVDPRTCELPVKLEPGKVYRVGLNSKSKRNFKSVGGIPLRPRVVAFVTRGGDPALADAVKAPKVVSMVPDSATKDVDPATDKLVVTFDRPMAPGFSWTGGGENYPETTGAPTWSEDKKTCTLPVKLKPGWTYRVGLNSPSHNNFQSAFGIPLEPVAWTFQTAGAAPAG